MRSTRRARSSSSPRHDAAISRLIRRLRDEYIAFIRQKEYWHARRLQGEADLLAFREDGLVDVYEVKLSPRRSAYRQVIATARLVSREYEVGRLFVYTESMDHIQEVVPEKRMRRVKGWEEHRRG